MTIITRQNTIGRLSIEHVRTSAPPYYMISSVLLSGQILQIH